MVAIATGFFIESFQYTFAVAEHARFFDSSEAGIRNARLTDSLTICALALGRTAPETGGHQPEMSNFGQYPDSSAKQTQPNLRAKRGTCA
jgi:hypothetical protein